MAEVQVQVLEYDGCRDTGQSVQVPIELAARRGPKSTNGPPGVCVLIDGSVAGGRRRSSGMIPGQATPPRVGLGFQA